MKKNARILGRTLAREISRQEIEATNGAAGDELSQPVQPLLPGVATQTLRYPPDSDTLGGGGPIWV
jgi:hypothetical protein